MGNSKDRFCCDEACMLQSSVKVLSVINLPVVAAVVTVVMTVVVVLIDVSFI